jgi:hypothetical protein
MSKFAWLVVFLPICSCIVQSGITDSRQINFSLLEEKSRLKPADQTQDLITDKDRMEDQVRSYLEGRFPRGYPLSAALSELRNGGATCYFVTDPEEKNTFVCDFSHPGYGLIGHFFVDLDWVVILHFDDTDKEILSLEVNFEESSF